MEIIEVWWIWTQRDVQKTSRSVKIDQISGYQVLNNKFFAGKNSSLRRSAPTASASSLRANADADMKNPLRASAQISAGSTGDWFKQLNDWASTKSKDGTFSTGFKKLKNEM